MSDTRKRRDRRAGALARLGFGEPFVTSVDFGGVVLASCNVCGARHGEHQRRGPAGHQAFAVAQIRGDGPAMTADEPTLDRWGGQTAEDRIVAAFSRLEELLRARDGHNQEDET